MKTIGSRLPLWVFAVSVIMLLALLLMEPKRESAATQEERRIAEVLSAMAGAGRVEVALYYAPQETDAFARSGNALPTGALVVAEGAEDMAVRLDLIRAVRTLLGLPETAVDVFVMEDDES